MGRQKRCSSLTSQPAGGLILHERLTILPTCNTRRHINKIERTNITGGPYSKNIPVGDVFSRPQVLSTPVVSTNPPNSTNSNSRFDAPPGVNATNVNPTTTASIPNSKALSASVRPSARANTRESEEAISPAPAAKQSELK